MKGKENERKKYESKPPTPWDEINFILRLEDYICIRKEADPTLL